MKSIHNHTFFFYKILELINCGVIPTWVAEPVSTLANIGLKCWILTFPDRLKSSKCFFKNQKKSKFWIKKWRQFQKGSLRLANCWKINEVITLFISFDRYLHYISHSPGFQSHIINSHHNKSKNWNDRLLSFKIHIS